MSPGRCPRPGLRTDRGIDCPPTHWRLDAKEPRCDECVSDGISMLVEFQIANKPVIHVAREGHRPFNELGRVAERGFHTVATTAEARGSSSGSRPANPIPWLLLRRRSSRSCSANTMPPARSSTTSGTTGTSAEVVPSVRSVGPRAFSRMGSSVRASSRRSR